MGIDHGDCGNAPRQMVLPRIYYDLVNKTISIDNLKEIIKEEVIWEIKGKERIIGQVDFIKNLTIYLSRVKDITIEKVITHGYFASTFGVIHLENEKIAFADFLEFSGVKRDSKIKKIQSYYVKEVN